MHGYIALISRKPDAAPDAEDAYEVCFPEIDGCCASGPTVSAAMHAAERELNRYVLSIGADDDASGELPQPKPATAMLGVAEQEGAVAAICIRLRRAA